MFCFLLTVLKFLKLWEVDDLVQFLVCFPLFITHIPAALSKGKASKSFSCFKKIKISFHCAKKNAFCKVVLIADLKAFFTFRS